MHSHWKLHMWAAGLLAPLPLFKNENTFPSSTYNAPFPHKTYSFHPLEISKKLCFSFMPGNRDLAGHSHVTNKAYTPRQQTDLHVLSVKLTKICLEDTISRKE